MIYLKYPKLIKIKELLNEDLFPIKSSEYRDLIIGKVGTLGECRKLINFMLDRSIIRSKGKTSNAVYHWLGDSAYIRPEVSSIADHVYEIAHNNELTRAERLKLIEYLKVKFGFFSRTASKLNHPKYAEIMDLIDAGNFPIASDKLKRQIMACRDVGYRSAANTCCELIKDGIIEPVGNSKGRIYNLVID